MKIWHDDIRPAPDGWVWARTNARAIDLLLNGDVEEISLDHDLGLDHIEMPETYAELQQSDPEQAHNIFLAGRSEDSGFRLACWMVANDKIPLKITIHSWNPAGAQNMANVFNAAGHDVTIAPFQV